MNAKELLAQYRAGKRDFHNVDLAGLDLTWSVLSDADFSGANLQGVIFNGATLHRVNFSGNTNLSLADLSRAELIEANLKGTNLEGANLTNTNLDRASFDETTCFPKGFQPPSIPPTQPISQANANHTAKDWETAIAEKLNSDLSETNINLNEIPSKIIERKIEEIEKRVDIKSKLCGRLLNWQNPSDPFWHYGIGLSDSYVFDTGAQLWPFAKKDAKLVMGIENIEFLPTQTIERLKYSLYVFSDWQYSSLGWNCEHLARLISTNQPRSYQCQFTWWLSNLEPNGDHKTAKQALQNYLEKMDPSLINIK